MPDPSGLGAALQIAGASVSGYLLGSLPTARWAARGSGVDPLVAGEGNPGAANVWRLLGPRAGLTVLAADIGKGALAALAGLWLGGWWAGCSGLVLAMAGHAWPPWSRFRGGRSVACLIGGGLVLAPLPFLIALGVFLLLLRLVGLWRAAAAGLLAYPPLIFFLVSDHWRLIGIGVAYLVLLAAWRLGQRRHALPAGRTGPT